MILYLQSPLPFSPPPQPKSSSDADTQGFVDCILGWC